MPRQIIASADAPKAIGPYSQAVRCGNTLYFSGQTPIDPATSALVAGDIAAPSSRIVPRVNGLKVGWSTDSKRHLSPPSDARGSSVEVHQTSDRTRDSVPTASRSYGR